MFLAPLTAIKFDDVESVEIYSLIALSLVAAAIYHNHLRLRASRSILTLARAYLIFLALAAVLALLALRLPTFPPPGVSLIKTAPYLSIARLMQTVAAIGSLLITAEFIAARPSLCALAAQCYVYAGVLSCAYGLLSLVASFAGLDLGGAYGPLHRVRAFFVEGGPFGVYVVSVMLVCMFRRRVLHRGDPRAYWFQLGLLFIALACAKSKAAILLAVFLGIYYMVATKRLRNLLALAPVLVALALIAKLPIVLMNYGENYLNFAKIAAQNPNDPNLVEGRIMAAILVPIMVAHHPITGIGIGNYPLQRNNPEYLGSLPTTTGWDLPGLGLLGYSAEFGIPLLLYFYWLLWRPVTICRQTQAPTLVAMLASYQAFAHTLGAQPTFVYPWVVSAMALGYSLARPESESLLARETDCADPSARTPAPG